MIGIPLIRIRIRMKSIFVVNAFYLSLASTAENQVRADLIADAETIVPAATIRVGLLLTLPKHAHVYWRNPGDSGLASGVEWNVPQGVTVGDLQWPNPKRFEVEGLEDTNHGYEDQILLYSDVSVPKDAFGTLTLSVRAYWLLCLDDGVCIPEDAELSLVVPIASTKKPSAHIATFDTFAARVPRSSESHDVPLKIQSAKDVGKLTVTTTAPWEFIATSEEDEANFFPDEGVAWRRVGPRANGGSIRAEFRAAKADEAVFTGVLTLLVRNTQTEKYETLFVSIAE